MPTTTAAAKILAEIKRLDPEAKRLRVAQLISRGVITEPVAAEMLRLERRQVPQATALRALPAPAKTPPSSPELWPQVQRAWQGFGETMAQTGANVAGLARNVTQALGLRGTSEALQQASGALTEAARGYEKRREALPEPRGIPATAVATVTGGALQLAPYLLTRRTAAAAALAAAQEMHRGPVPAALAAGTMAVLPRVVGVAERAGVRLLPAAVRAKAAPYVGPAVVGATAGGLALSAGKSLTEAGTEAILYGGVGRLLRRPPAAGAPPRAARPFENRLKIEFYDEYDPIRALTEVGRLPADKSAYVAARNYAGHLGKIYERQRELGDILRPVRGQGLLKELSEYMEWERHLELANRPDIGPTYRMPAGRTVAQVLADKTALEARLGPERMGFIERQAEQVRDFSNRLLNYLRESQVISNTAYDAIRANNLRYAPLQRVAFIADQLERLPVGARSFSVTKQDIVESIKGSELEILDPLQGFIRNIYKSVITAERNQVALTLSEYANRPEYSNLVRRLGTLRRGGRLVMERPRPEEAKFSVLRDGKKIDYAAPAAVVDSLKGLNAQEAALLTRLAGWTNTALREGATTLYLPFIARNAWRDFQTAMIRSPVGFSPLEWLKGFASSVGQDRHFHEFMESGAAFSGFFERARPVSWTLERISESRLRRIGRTVLNPVELLRTVGTKVELAPRIGVYRRARRAGKSEAEAAFIARDVTVDFSKMGTKMRTMNQWIPFINARTQGAINIFKAFREQPVRAAAVAAGMIGIPAVTSYLHNVSQFPEIYDDIPSWIKDNYFLWIYGNTRDKDGNPADVVKIPKGDVGRYFANPLENFLEYLEGRDPKSLDQVATALASDISPIEFARRGRPSGYALLSSVTPPTLKAFVVEPIANRELYTGGPIIRRGLQGAVPQEQYRAVTPEWIVSIGRKLHVSPLLVQNAIQAQFGGVGRALSADLPPGTTPGQEIRRRTGLATAMEQFKGVRGSGVRERRFEELETEREAVATEQVIERRNAERLLTQLGSLNPADRFDWFRNKLESGEITEPVADALVRTMKRQAGGLDPFEAVLVEEPVKVRARIVAKQLQRLAAEERRNLAARWIEKKIITEAVAKEMLQLEQR